jgi:hypothetical protein
MLLEDLWVGVDAVLHLLTQTQLVLVGVAEVLHLVFVVATRRVLVDYCRHLQPVLDSYINTKVLFRPISLISLLLLADPACSLIALFKLLRFR